VLIEQEAGWTAELVWTVLIVFWVRDLTAPMHLGLNWPFVPHVNQKSPQSPTKVPDGPQIKGALLLQQGSRWPRYLVSYYPPGPKGRKPDMHV
jgi:hypothetical protein